MSDAQSRATGELREIAGELADGLIARGLTLGDVERMAPLLVDRFRLSSRAAPGPDDEARAAG